jgi:hypothetical protein
VYRGSSDNEVSHNKIHGYNLGNPVESDQEMPYGWGLDIEGVSSSVHDNEVGMTREGWGGLIIADIDGLVEDNLIYHGEDEIKSTSLYVVGRLGNCIIRRNHLIGRDVVYSRGLSLWCHAPAMSNAVIESNIIDNYYIALQLKELEDTIVRYNELRNSQMGIRFDGGTRYTVTKNKFINCVHPIMNEESITDSVIEDNTIE